MVKTLPLAFLLTIHVYSLRTKISLDSPLGVAKRKLYQIQRVSRLVLSRLERVPVDCSYAHIAQLRQYAISEAKKSSPTKEGGNRVARMMYVTGTVDLWVHMRAV